MRLCQAVREAIPAFTPHPGREEGKRDETPYHVSGQIFQASDRENQDEWDQGDVPGNGRDQGNGL